MNIISLRMTSRQFDVVVLTCLLSMLALPTLAQEQIAASPDVVCNTDGNCNAGDQVVLQVRTRGERDAQATGVGSAQLQTDRRVDITRESGAPGNVLAVGRFSVQLGNGGVIWATEDPTLTEPVLNVQTSSLAAFDNGRIVEPLRFHTYGNYTAFIQRMQISIYRATDSDMVTPLATLDVPVANVGEAEWDGKLPDGITLHQGDELQYILRAYDADGRVDETFPGRLQLVTPAERERGLQQLRNNISENVGTLSAQQLESRQLVQGIYGLSLLRQQNITVYGSRVRLQGQDLPEGYQLKINGQSIPVDQQRKFVAEYLLPVGAHHFDIALDNAAGSSATIQRDLDVDVSGRYLFLVAIADFTASQSSTSGSIEPLANSDRYDDSLVEGRLAFYLKGKVKGKYLITAQADTQERKVSDLFTGFLDADPRDIFRHLDPDQYYPVYGDDSTTYRDVDTQGRLYVRLNWDKSQLLWGNYQTAITGNEYAQYVRSLYGAALDWRSNASTELGEASSTVKAFTSQAQSALGHSELLGTGGSLYYLRDTDLLPGSDNVVLEVRDHTTGRVEVRAPLVRDVDYQIDELQGRIIMTRPLAQISRENLATITHDQPLDGFDNVLMVDYEYVPAGFNAGDLTTGFRGKHWFGEHVALGATYIDENRSGDNYGLKGVDLTLQAGRGTYLKLEQARSESTVAPLFYSDNGGLSFTQINPTGTDARSGDARSVEARANLKELGWTTREWTMGAWWRDVDPGYSVARFDQGLSVHETGFEFLGELSPNLKLSGRASHAERGADHFDQGQLSLVWQIDEHSQLTGELRQVTETLASVSDAKGSLFALRYGRRLGTALDVYGIAQLTLDDDGGAYPDNNAYTLGANYALGDIATVGAEITSGDRGDAAQVNAEYRLSQEHSLYAAYTYSTDETLSDPFFGGGRPAGLTLGQRWRLSNQVNLYNESQFLKSGTDTGIAHTFGMDFYPWLGWNLGFTLQNGDLQAASGQVDRQAISINGGHSSANSTWASSLEHRKDSGAEQRSQWVSTNRLQVKLNDSWRIAGRVNYSHTTDDLDPLADAKFIESNIGFAWRPWDSTRWALLGKYTYLYDLASLGQLGTDSQYDQRTNVLSLEGVYQYDSRWEFAGKLAQRSGDTRLGRGTGSWFDSRASLAAVQTRYRLYEKWSGLAEYRWLGVRDGGDRQGWLVSVDREVTDNFRVGVGYNFTDFNDDLTRQDYQYEGWFLNVAGSY